jgi:hypothetical protein
MVPLTRPDFLAMLVTELHLCGEPFERWCLTEWLASMWPWVEDDPDVHRWATEFLAAQRQEAMRM